MTNSYYADINTPTVADFWNFAFGVKQFDAAFSASDTRYLAITGTPVGLQGGWASTSARIWAPNAGNLTGVRQVGNPLPWRWTLNVSFYNEQGKAHPRQYHDAVSKEDLGWNDRGGCVLRIGPNFNDTEESRFGPLGSYYRDWLRIGVGSAEPGNALGFLHVSQVRPSGITVKNKARRAQALIFNRAVTFQAQIVGLLQAGGLQIGELLLLHSEDTGHWIRATLKQVTQSLIACVVGMAQAHHDLSTDGKDGKINGGSGWNSRYGVTNATLAGKLDFLKQKQQMDLKELQKYPTFVDAGGDEWFTQENAREWFTVADEWAQYIGAFGAFDFLNPDQSGLVDESRLDNYTPNYPDLPYRVDGLPRPIKNPRRLQEPLGLII